MCINEYVACALITGTTEEHFVETTSNSLDQCRWTHSCCVYLVPKQTSLCIRLSIHNCICMDIIMGRTRELQEVPP